MLKGFTRSGARAPRWRSSRWPSRRGRAAAAPATDSGGASGGKTTLTLKGITDNQQTWEELIADYKKENPDVTIKAIVRADRPAPDRAARAARRRRRARPVRRLARQRQRDVGQAARAERAARRPLRPGMDRRRSPRTRARCSASTTRPTCGRRA